MTVPKLPERAVGAMRALCKERSHHHGFVQVFFRSHTGWKELLKKAVMLFQGVGAKWGKMPSP